MCYVIVTCRSMLWTLMSIAATLLITGSVISPKWLIGEPKQFGFNIHNRTTISETTYNPTVGIFNRCTMLLRFYEKYERENCATFVSGYGMSDDDFPHAWKAALVLFSIGGLMLVFTMITSVISLCARTMCGKSIFTMSGLIQSIAGLFCIVGLLIYPVGWGSRRAKNLCGELSEPFYMDNCSLGWSFYVCIAGTLLVYACAILSIKADSSTSSQKVEEEVLEGKNLICVL